MPDPVLRLDPTRLAVEPGGQVRTVVTVANTGPIVEGFRVDVVGAAAAWAEVLTPEISVYPRQETPVVVAFSPPAGSASSGEVPFGVRVVSLVDAAASAVAEGDLEIGKVFGLQSKITPVNSAGRWSARHRIELTNWGNAPVRLRLVATDPDEKLGFLLAPETVDVPLGGNATARLKVRTRAPTLRGSPARLPFRVVGEPDPPPPAGATPGVPDPRQPVLDASFNQRPILSRGVVAAAGLVLVGAVAITGFALTLGGSKNSAEDGSGAPPPPVLLAAAPAGPGAVRLAWTLRARIDSYKIVVRDSTGAPFRTVPNIDGALSVTTVNALASATRYCFIMQAFRGKQPSAESKPKCQTTAKIGPSESPTAGGGDAPPGSGSSTNSPTPGGTATNPSGVPSDQPSFTPADWIAVVILHDASDPSAGLASSEAAKLTVDPPARAGVLDSIYFPGLPYLRPQRVVYVGPFASDRDARLFCDSSKTPCMDDMPHQPGPAKSPGPQPTSVGPS
jgi:hypothetical protein